MKKFWRSGMIDKKVVKEREQEEYINRLQRTILELSRPENTNDKSLTFEEMLDFYIKYNKNRPQYDDYIGVENNKLLDDKDG